MHRGVMRMIREMITEDFPVSLNENFNPEPPPHDESMPQSLSGHLCTPECLFFRDPGHPGSVAAMDIQAYSSLGNGISSAFGVDDETLMFPLLFGSAEF